MSTNTLTSPWWRYLRISLRGLIVLVLAFGGGLGWFVTHAKVQLDAVTAIERAGGSVKYELEWKVRQFKPTGKLWWPRPTSCRSVRLEDILGHRSDRR
jgi:hypothetical protein